MKINIELSEVDLQVLVLENLRYRLGNVNLKAEDVKIEVRSKQNYRAEWEPAEFRARVRPASATVVRARTVPRSARAQSRPSAPVPATSPIVSVRPMSWPRRLRGSRL